MSDIAFTEQTSASDTFIAFEYQYYYFLLQILKLKHGESAGMEVLDDVHTRLQNNRQILVQVKHTIQKGSQGNPINLTELDIDLWKTLSNWTKVICDKNDERTTESSQLAFIEKTEFLLTSNKSLNEKNRVIHNIAKYKDGDIEYDPLDQYIQNLKRSTSNKKLYGYIEQVLSLPKVVKKAFFRKVGFELEAQLPIELCKQTIKEKMIDDKLVDDVFSSLDSHIRQDNFIRIYNGMFLEIDFDEFYRKYRILFDRARNPNLKISPYEGVLPDNIVDQCFIQQLIDIDDIDIGEEELAYEYTRLKLAIESNIEQWIIDGELTYQERDDLERDVIALWKTEFRSLNRPRPTDEEMANRARDVLNRLRRERLKISNQDLTVEMSHGELYSLSDKPVIGWHVDWEGKYK